MKPFKPKHYFRASLERMRQAQVLYRHGNSYALCMYLAGLAVECMLRAFKGRRASAFDEKHDLLRLFKGSGLLHQTEEESSFAKRREMVKWINEIAVLWSNDYRYASEDRLRLHLHHKVFISRKLKGDLLKAHAVRIIHASEQFIDRGTLLWDHI